MRYVGNFDEAPVESRINKSGAGLIKKPASHQLAPLQTHWNECSVLFHLQNHLQNQMQMPNGKKAPVKRSTKSTAARNDAQLDTRGDGVHTTRVGDRTADHLNNRIFFRLFQVGNTLQRQAVKELGVTTVQWAVLGALSDPRPRNGIKSGISLSTLADFLVVSRQNLDGVLKRLERDGLVERVTDDGDKRARVVRLTPHGLSFWTDLEKRIYQFYAQAASTFRFDERVALVHYLNSLQRELTKVRLETRQGTTVKKPRP
jgi:DNA-binding MarR family transcriptional regulator